MLGAEDDPVKHSAVTCSDRLLDGFTFPWRVSVEKKPARATGYTQGAGSADCYSCTIRSRGAFFLFPLLRCSWGRGLDCGPAWELQWERCVCPHLTFRVLPRKLPKLAHCAPLGTRTWLLIIGQGRRHTALS